MPLPEVPVLGAVSVGALGGADVVGVVGFGLAVTGVVGIEPGEAGASQARGISATGKIQVAERITPWPLLKLLIVSQLHPMKVLM